MRKPPKMSRKKIVAWMMAILVIILIALHYIFVKVGIDDTERICSKTIDNAKEKLETYDNYIANDETKSLVRLLDKTTEFANNLCDTDFTSMDLNKYVTQQRITGIIVLDKNMHTVLQTSCDGDTYLAWKDILQSDSVKEIIEYPKKVYMLRTETLSGTYDIAAIARVDAPGVIMAYVLQDMIKEGVNDISPDNLFDGMIIDHDGFLVIAKDNKVISVNDEDISRQSAYEWENLCKKGEKVTENICKVEYDGKDWYMSEARYRDYEIHLMLSVNEVYRQYFIIDFVIIMLYILFCIGIAWVAGHVERRNNVRIQKYYHIIDAVNSVYMSSLLVYTDNGKAEWIKLSERLSKRISEYSNVDRIVRSVAQTYVQKPYMDAYLEFTDINTVKERLKGKRFISYTYENVYNQWITISIIPQKIEEDGDIKAVLYLTGDMTEEMEKEKEYQKQLKLAGDAKTNFLRRMSHDIRTPINGIRGILQIAKNEPQNLEKQKEYREKVDVASGYLLDLVNNVLDMSKIESGEIKLEHKPFDLMELLNKTNDIIIMQCNECGITYHIENFNIAYKKLIGSPLHLQQILLNIGGNAVKYNTENGEIFVSCHMVSVSGDTVVYEFVCRDTGIGMSAEYQKHIFEPFTQENGAARTRYAGTGLGMSIVKELTELQGGTVSFKSEQGKGSEFTVQLPFEIDNSAEQSESRVGEEAEYSIKGLKILLAEDNDLNMEIAEHLLTERGAIVTKAHNGQEAVDEFLKSDEGYFDLILMDIMMPVMGGWEASRRIRNMKRSDAATIPIIAMTANAFQEDIEHSFAAGMNEHVSKPLDMNVLVKTISEIK